VMLRTETQAQAMQAVQETQETQTS
jgi:hypothetical protein